MSQRPKIYYTEAQIGMMWDRWQRGESLHAACGSRRAMRDKIPSIAEAVAASGRNALAHDNAKAVVDSTGLPRSR